MTSAAHLRRPARHLGALLCIALAATALTAQPALASANVEGLLQNVVDMLENAL